jgi:hypothetical protein
MALTPFSNEVAGAWRIFRAHWRTAVQLTLLALVSLLFFLPFVVERAAFLSGGPDTATLPNSAFSTLLGLVAVVVFLLLSMTAKAGIFIAFMKRGSMTMKVAFRGGLRILPSFLGTELLVAFLLAVSLLPAAGLALWYFTMGVTMPLANPFQTTADLVSSIVMILFLVPAIALSMWLAFAPLAAAVGDARGGIPALRYSVDLVRGRAWRVLKRIFVWIIFSNALTLSVSPLPIAKVVVPFVLSLLGAAYLVVVYKELRGR